MWFDRLKRFLIESLDAAIELWQFYEHSWRFLVQLLFFGNQLINWHSMECNQQLRRLAIACHFLGRKYKVEMSFSSPLTRHAISRSERWLQLRETCNESKKIVNLLHIRLANWVKLFDLYHGTSVSTSWRSRKDLLNCFFITREIPPAATTQHRWRGEKKKVKMLRWKDGRGNNLLSGQP